MRGRRAAFVAALIVVSGCTPRDAVEVWLAARGATVPQAAQVRAAIGCESGWNPHDNNGADAGLLQVNVADAHSVGHREVVALHDLEDIGLNLDVAWRMVFGWVDGDGNPHPGHGWRAWAPRCRAAAERAG